MKTALTEHRPSTRRRLAHRVVRTLLLVTILGLAVTPETRDQTAAENAQAIQRRVLPR